MRPAFFFAGTVGSDWAGNRTAARLANGYFYALDARTGQVLWQSSLAGPVTSGVVSYAVGARQYVVVAAGDTLFAFGLRQ